MKPFTLFFLILALSACGQAESSETEIQKPGVTPDQALVAYLEAEFNEAKACSGFEIGSFDTLSISMMPPIFPCPHYPGGCTGEFAGPSRIRLGASSQMRHETIHFLLHVNTGDSDPGHQNAALFNDCA